MWAAFRNKCETWGVPVNEDSLLYGSIFLECKAWFENGWKAKEQNNHKPLFTYSYGEEAYGLVYANDKGGFDVYSIPQYGGDERLEKSFNEYSEAERYSKSFT